MVVVVLPARAFMGEANGRESGFRSIVASRCVVFTRVAVVVRGLL